MTHNQRTFTTPPTFDNVKTPDFLSFTANAKGSASAGRDISFISPATRKLTFVGDSASPVYEGMYRCQ
jgi:hypothetical protein